MLKVDAATAAGTWERGTKIERIRQHESKGGALIHVGDLVYCKWTLGLEGGYSQEGQVVDIVKGKVVIDLGEDPKLWRDDGTRRYSCIYVNDVELIACRQDR
jgi:hypothetical protein